MKIINKRNLYSILFLSGILILVLFFSRFSFSEGLTTPTQVVNTTPPQPMPATNTTPPQPMPATNTTPPQPMPATNTTTNTNSGSSTVHLQVSPATAAILSGALDSIVQMGFAAVKTTNAVVQKMDDAVKNIEATATVPTSTSTSSTNWVPIPTTSTRQ